MIWDKCQTTYVITRTRTLQRNSKKIRQIFLKKIWFDIIKKCTKINLYTLNGQASGLFNFWNFCNSPVKFVEVGKNWFVTKFRYTLLIEYTKSPEVYPLYTYQEVMKFILCCFYYNSFIVKLSTEMYKTEEAIKLFIETYLIFTG